mmetsp:Transcript_1247/g.3153  ORF Transcript_1247/g.3153 Transcript_1247/m.3153 type:complete len:179 (-) Transcript_1247:88-624(-)
MARQSRALVVGFLAVAGLLTLPAAKAEVTEAIHDPAEFIEHEVSHALDEHRVEGKREAAADLPPHRHVRGGTTSAIPPQPVPTANGTVDHANVTAPNLLRRLTGWCPDKCAGYHCPGSWVAHNDCNRCTCVCPPGRRCSNPNAGRNSGCKAVWQSCFISAECCSSRCTSVHLCAPPLR